MNAPTLLNEVDLDAVGGLAAKIEEVPEVAATVWKADVTWLGGFRSEAAVRGFTLPSDEPTSLGGNDSAANPVEQLLAALGNCLAVGYAANASKAGIRIDDMQISLEGDLDLHTFLGLKDEHAGYEAIRVAVDITSDASEEQLKALHTAVVGSSPVGHTLSRAVPVSIGMV
jgi:uncharacterized OsmC-like protein